MRVVSITVLGKYRVDATINKENMLQRIHTWVPDPVLGDMNYEHEFTNDSYIDIGNGIKFPTGWHSHEGWDDNFQAPEHQRRPQRVRRHDEGRQGERLPRPGGRPRLGAAGDLSGPRGDARSWPTASTCSAARRTTAWPSSSTTSSRSSRRRSNEERSLAVIEEIVKLIPNKPIRFVINSHQHFDHAGGLRTYMHIGATIITHWKNFDFYNRDFLNYAPRTLKPDMVSLWPPTELAEGYYYETVRENYVLSDGTRNLNIYYVNPLQHVEGMLMAYLPKEKILIEADLVDTNAPLPAGSRATSRVSTGPCGR